MAHGTSQTTAKRDCPKCEDSNTFNILEVVGFDKIRLECSECGIWIDPDDLQDAFIEG